MAKIASGANDDSQPRIAKQTSVRNEYNFNTGNAKSDDGPEENFWDRNFEGQSSASFEKIWECFITEYQDDLETQFDEKEMKWLKNLLFKEAFGRSKVISRQRVMEFRGIDLKDE